MSEDLFGGTVAVRRPYPVAVWPTLTVPACRSPYGCDRAAWKRSSVKIT